MAKMRVELEQQDWQLVLDLVQQGSYRVVAPLIGKLAEQLNAIPQPTQQPANSEDKPPVN